MQTGAIGTITFPKTNESNFKAILPPIVLSQPCYEVNASRSQ